MTQLAFQKVMIDDCESWIAEEYYNWGKAKIEPDWKSASKEEKRRGIRRGWMMYDGCSIPQDNIVSASDAGLTVTIYSRISADDVKQFLVAQSQISAMLEKIPAQSELKDTSDLELKIVGDAIDEFCKVSEGIQRSKATKVLHKKRPAFLPVIDGNVQRTLFINFPHILQEGATTASYLTVCREVLQRRAKSLDTIQKQLHEHWAIEISIARILSFLLYQWYKRTDLPTGKLVEFWQTSQFRNASREMWNQSK